jgi:hypothetical protein
MEESGERSTEVQTLDSQLFAPIRSPNSVLRVRFFQSLSLPGTSGLYVTSSLAR